MLHERRSIRPLFQIYTHRNLKESMKNSFKHCKLYIDSKNHKNNPKM
jgi:hypothetical protein